MEPGKLQCYCGDIIRDPGHMVPCTHCKKLFHPSEYMYKYKPLFVGNELSNILSNITDPSAFNCC